MTTVISTDFNNIARAISAYADAARADNTLLLSTALVGSDARITDAGENFTGTIRWTSYTDGSEAAKPSPTNTAVDALDSAVLLSAANQAEIYVKNVDVTGAKENSVQSLISKVDGLSYLGAQFGAVRARKEDNNLRSILGGIGSNILGTYAAPTANTAAAVHGTFGYVTEYVLADLAWNPLFVQEDTANNRSSFFDTLLDAMSAVSGEFEEPFYYLVVNSNTFNTIRKQNVLDVNPVTDGNLTVNTLLGGKIRLIVTNNTITTGGLPTGLVASYLVKAGALNYSNVAVNNPTAIDTNPTYNRGFGDVTILSRWGNIIHPRGYSFGGTVTSFPTNATLATAASWTSVAGNVNQTGIFPIFHG